MNLSPSPQLGMYYMVPYKDKNRGYISQFQIGYKGLIQLAIRSGQYRSLNVVPVHTGEIRMTNPLFEEFEYTPITDEEKLKTAKTVGYIAAFELTNGFRKTLYWTREQMLDHADRFSAAFHKDAVKSPYPNKQRVSFADYEAGKYPREDEWKYSSFWYKNFDAMACKTMLRQLISKWGVMSIDFQTAYEADGAVLNNDGTKDYIDTPEYTGNVGDFGVDAQYVAEAPQGSDENSADSEPIQSVKEEPVAEKPKRGRPRKTTESTPAPAQAPETIPDEGAIIEDDDPMTDFLSNAGNE